MEEGIFLTMRSRSEKQSGQALAACGQSTPGERGQHTEQWCVGEASARLSLRLFLKHEYRFHNLTRHKDTDTVSEKFLINLSDVIETSRKWLEKDSFLGCFDARSS